MEIIYPSGQHLFSGKTSILRQLDLDTYVYLKELAPGRIIQCRFSDLSASNEKYRIVDLYRPNEDFRAAAAKYPWVACSLQKM